VPLVWSRSRRRGPARIRVSSFETLRPRPAPDVLTGVSIRGEKEVRNLEGLTLIVAIKQSCDGCRDFVFSDLRELRGTPVVIVSATGDLNDEWAGAAQPILVAPDVLKELEIRWPPFYVLVNPEERRVVIEGVVFAPGQVASEIAPYLVAP
jgi:hypothetical protein